MPFRLLDPRPFHTLHAAAAVGAERQCRGGSINFPERLHGYAGDVSVWSGSYSAALPAMGQYS